MKIKWLNIAKQLTLVVVLCTIIGGLLEYFFPVHYTPVLAALTGALIGLSVLFLTETRWPPFE